MPERDPLSRRTLGSKDMAPSLRSIGLISRLECVEELSGWIWICPVCTKEALRFGISSAATITISRPGNATKNRMVRRLDIIAPIHAAPIIATDSPDRISQSSLSRGIPQPDITED